MNCSETLGIDGLPPEQPLPQRISTKTLSIMRNRKTCDSTSKSRVHPKVPQIESFSRSLRGSNHQEKRHKALMCESLNKHARKRPQIQRTKNPKKKAPKITKNNPGKIITQWDMDGLLIFNTWWGQSLYKEASNLPTSNPLDDLQMKH